MLNFLNLVRWLHNNVFVLRKRTLRYFRVKEHHVCKLVLNGLKKKPFKTTYTHSKRIVKG